MRIAFLSDTFLPQVNGVATSMANFARELGKRGHQVLIVCPAPTRKSRRERPWSAPNVKVVRMPSIPAVLYPEITISPFVGLPWCLAVIRRFKPDVVHLHTTIVISFDAIAVTKLLNTPLIATNHNFLTKKDYDCIRFLTKNPGLQKPIAMAALAYSLAFFNACDLCLAPSKRLINALVRDGYSKRLVYLPNGVPRPPVRSLPEVQRERLRKRYGLGSKVILHIGRLSMEKRVDDIIRAMPSLEKNVSLLIIGDGPHRKALEKLTKELGIKDRVVFTGFIPNDQMLASALPAVADVFVTASPMESQGMVLVEAMAFGLPLVGADSAAIPEVIDDAGILVKPGDVNGYAAALKKILSNSSLREGLRAKSLRRFEEYSIDKLTDRLVAIYKRERSRHARRPRNTITAVPKKIVKFLDPRRKKRS